MQDEKKEGPVQEMDRAVRCLGLELPESVHQDAKAKWEVVKEGMGPANTPGASRLVWSWEKPTADGFYWHRYLGNAEVSKVRVIDGEPKYFDAGDEGWANGFVDECEWAGLISEPSEPAGLPEAKPEGPNPLPLPSASELEAKIDKMIHHARFMNDFAEDGTLYSELRKEVFADIRRLREGTGA
jgi:hypothetical protein